MPKIAVIEDQPDLCELLHYSLAQRGYHAVCCSDGLAALDFLRRERPDLVVLDILLPGLDGIEICRRMRADRLLSRTPTIFLTARDSETDRVLALEIGGDDYLAKPFSVRELCARIRVRLPKSAEAADVLSVGPLELNRSAFTVRLNGQPLSLTATEFRLLEHLMSSPGQVFRRERLLDAVWGGRSDVLERTVDAFIARLRNKIEEEPSRPHWIQSKRGVGYAFRARAATGGA